MDKQFAKELLKNVEEKLSVEERLEYFNLRYYGYLDILETFEFKEGMNILDIGFEPAHLEMALKGMNLNMYGISHELWHAQSKDRASSYGIKYELLNAEKDKFPYEDNTFDLIIMTEIMEHFYLDCYNALRESFRVLKQGGKIIITTPNAVSGHRRFTLLFGKLNRQHPREAFKRTIYHKHHFLYKLDELKDLCEDVGFKIVKKEYLRLDEKVCLIKREWHKSFVLCLDYFMRRAWYIIGMLPSMRSHIKVVCEKEKL